MSTPFSKNFESSVESLADELDVKGSDNEDFHSRFSEVPVSTTFLSPGDIVFFKYVSEKYGYESEHVTMLIGNKKSDLGIYLGKKKLNKYATLHRKYMAAVKLNKVWSFTASLIVSAYKDSTLKYVKKPKNLTQIGPAPWIALVGRENYRSYIINNMTHVNKLNKPKEDS